MNVDEKAQSCWFRKSSGPFFLVPPPSCLSFVVPGNKKGLFRMYHRIQSTWGIRHGGATLCNDRHAPCWPETLRRANLFTTEHHPRDDSSPYSSQKPNRYACTVFYWQIGNESERRCLDDVNTHQSGPRFNLHQTAVDSISKYNNVRVR